MMLKLKRYSFFMFCLFCFCVHLNAQRKDISMARGYVKAGQNLEKAESMMRTLLKDSSNRDNGKIWDVLLASVNKQYDAVNEQIYLKQKADTGKLFLNTLKMFEICQSYDTIAVSSFNDGRQLAKQRKKRADYLLAYRANLYNGGMYFVKKNNFDEAYRMFDTYIGCLYHPLFSGIKFSASDSAAVRKAAYMSMYSAYKAHHYEETLKYAQLAMSDTAYLNYKYQYLVETFQALKDTSRYVSSLEAGFEKYPKSMFYFPRLFNYYFSEKGDMGMAATLCDKALKTDSTNLVFLIAKSSLLLQMDRYKECVDVCDLILSKDNGAADAYLNAGLAFFNQTVRINSSPSTARKQRTKLTQLYKSALPYMEKYQKLCPDGVKKWGIPLYTIYLNLNMGKEFEDIEKILQNGNK